MKTYKVNPEQQRGRPRQHPMTQFEIDCDQRTKKGLERTTPTINRPTGLRNIFKAPVVYIDGEWHVDSNPQKFYLLGYAYDKTHYGWLYNQNDYKYNGIAKAKPPVKGTNGLSKKALEQLFDGVSAIYFYGPDAGMIERMFKIPLKKKYRCINLLSLVKMCVPEKDLWTATKALQKKGIIEKDKYKNKPCYKLCCIEYLLGIKRSTLEYKKDVDNLHRDWYTPHLRAKALLYNKEDVLYMIEVHKQLYRQYGATKKMEEQCVLKPTK